MLTQPNRLEQYQLVNNGFNDRVFAKQQLAHHRNNLVFHVFPNRVDQNQSLIKQFFKQLLISVSEDCDVALSPSNHNQKLHSLVQFGRS